MAQIETNELSPAWAVFQKEPVLGRKETYVCHAGCLTTWEAHRNSQGFNRCRNCGLLYSKGGLKTVEQVEDAQRLAGCMAVQKKMKKLT